jgi:GT2 family glycosyltransferase
MLYRVPEESKTVIANTRLRHPLEITNFFHFTLPIKEKFFINYIDLFFKVDEGPRSGRFSVDIVINEKSTRFVIPHESLQSNTPLRMSVESRPLVSDKIDVYLKTEGMDTPLLLWINEVGPCVVVNGDCSREVELARSPLVSIVTPVYDSVLEYLTQTVESVLGQVYTNWELCLVDDGTCKTELIRYLHSLKDPRIKVRINRLNRGISEATNIAIGMSTGEYTCFLDHDDLLTKDALLEVASVINAYPTVKLIYTDEDKITGEGKLVEPFYKPDWSYSMLLSQNYTCHLSTYATDRLKQLGGVRAGYEGSQDHDLVLRFIEGVEESEIRHIPRVLYHWRKHEQSTSSDISNKPYAHISGLRAVYDHVVRMGDEARVTSGRYMGSYDVDYKLKGIPIIHIIIPTRDNPVYLRTCCFSIAQSTYGQYTVTVVNNGSVREDTKELFEELRRDSRYQVIPYDQPFNYSKINNYAVQKGPDADLLLFLNDDTEVITTDWLERLAQHIGRDNTAVVGAKLLYGNNDMQHAGVIIGCGGIAGHSHRRVPDHSPGYFMRPHVVQNVSAVTGACMMISRDAFDEVGGFEESLPKAFNDIDLCLKVRERGYHVVYTPYVRLFHHESVSRGVDNAKEAEFATAIDYMNKKWHCSSYRDPYYNPNLSLVSETSSYKGVV